MEGKQMYAIRREFGAVNKMWMNNVTLISETKNYSYKEQRETIMLLHTLLDKKGGRNELWAEEWALSKAFYIPFFGLRGMKYH